MIDDKVKRNYNGNEVNELGDIISTIKNKYTKDSIHCKQTSGHFYNIYCSRTNDIEITVYLNPEDHNIYGSEIYYYKPNSHDIKHSRNYTKFENFPEKYNDKLNEIKDKFNNIFNIKVK